jgi:hypothetical protein
MTDFDAAVPAEDRRPYVVETTLHRSGRIWRSWPMSEADAKEEECFYKSWQVVGLKVKAVLIGDPIW